MWDQMPENESHVPKGGGGVNARILGRFLIRQTHFIGATTLENKNKIKKG